MRHRPRRGTGQLADLEQKRRLLEDLSARCAQDGVTVESAAPDAIDGVSPRLLAATRAGSPAGEPIILRGSGGRELIAVVDGQGHPGDIWEAIRARAGTSVVIRRRVEPDELAPGLTALAVRSDDRMTVLVSEAIPARLQRAGGQSALRAARRAGWTSNRVTAASLLFTGASLWRATLASGAPRFAAAGSAALIIAVIIGVGLVLTEPSHSAPVRAVITPGTPSSTPHVRGAAKRAGHAQTGRPGRARVLAHRQPHTAPSHTAKTTPTAATPTAVTSTPTGSPTSPAASSSPDPSPSPSPTKTKHCILGFIC
jgi:hypothetical protein